MAAKKAEAKKTGTRKTTIVEDLTALSEDALVARQHELTIQRQEVRAQALDIQAELDRRASERPAHPNPDAQTIGQE